MPGHVRVGGSWKTVSSPSVRVGGSWKSVTAGFTRVGGAWKQWYTAVQPSYELIETITLTGSQASFTFNNLSQYSTIYKHLQIRGVGRSDRGDDNSGLNIRFNGDTGNNYVWHNLQTLSGSFDFARQTSSSWINTGYTLAGGTLFNDLFGGYVIDIIDPYSTNKSKTVRSISGQPAGRNFVSVAGGAWMSTAAVNSITLIDGAGAQMVSRTRFSLYGIRG
jgi:hypothetical protein